MVHPITVQDDIPKIYERHVHGDNKPLLFSLGCGKKNLIPLWISKLIKLASNKFFYVPLSIEPFVINIVTTVHPI